MLLPADESASLGTNGIGETSQNIAIGVSGISRSLQGKMVIAAKLKRRN
jgi:hypothetical protein